MEQIQAMTPMQARLNLLGFCCIAAIIAANALYFQDAALFSKGKPLTSPDKQASPQKQVEKKAGTEIKPYKRASADKADTTSSLPEEVKAEAPEVSSEEDVSLEVVRAIQRELKARKYIPGKEDGAAGLLTRAAILAFEYDMGLPLTATPSESVLQNIIFGVPGARRDQDAEDKMTPTSVRIVKQAQKILNDLGYYTGKVHGRIDQKTRKAIREFEEDRSLKVTGRVSGKLMQELIKFADKPAGG